MSHYAVMVIGPDYEQQLAPYHEYECTGRDDEYVTDVDITDKVTAEFNQPVSVVKLADGTYRSRCDEALFTGTAESILGGTQKTFVLPEGATKVTLSAEEARVLGLGYASMDECATEYFGGSIIIRDGHYYKHTNENAKWDWYQLGGRWTGALKLKPNKLGRVGRSGLMTENAADGYADQALKGDIDFAQMRNDAEVKARALWKMTREITGGMAWDSWDDTLVRYPNINDARREYFDQPAIEMLKGSGKKAYSWEIDDELALDEATYIQRARDKACVYFAFVRDGQWTERGRMGWFATVSDEISSAQWNRMFNDMLDALPDDVLISIVDAHI